MSIVSISRTSPETVVSDYQKLMNLAQYKKTVSPDVKTILKLNLSWTLFYPSCSTPPWELEGVLKTLQDDDFQDVVAVENQTVVTHPWKGAYYNKWLPLLKKYQREFQPLTDVKWTVYEPKSEMMVMDEIFGQVLVPEMFYGNNVIHFPTVKTHGHTTTTGSMKNAFGGLIPKYRHHAHKKIHEVLVDLLAIQQEIHPGIFTVMDGSVCGNGAGPRTMDPVIGNLILASGDSVAVDALAAKIMGFDPLKIDYIKMAHDKGLGMGDVDQLEIVGMDEQEIKNLNLKFQVSKSPVIKWDQRLRKKTMNIKWLHHLLFNSPIFKTFIFASGFYHDRLWYPTTGKKNINEFKKTEWGHMFDEYEYGEFPEFKEVKEWNPY
ncbi:DUF362 domain-containing protein [Methanobacterium formicicum]|uniref:DUF362 domain-containing protein n=1 Tax=Methanobacterium formicicum (strain DSM 3637 / PP1) TaxID=1204725 RepID=K2RRR8_METFP|nr:DUF362 domain-containing protein [Methanobacterium formicicum]EKF85430.1 hypothetical protein A994_08351 [Methanobacterium formicicum DSM 3637]